MTEARTVAVVRDYSELVAALRARAEELNVSRVNLDHVSGLQSGYTAKLLANPPIKTLGAVSFGPLLGSLGLKILLIEDPEQLAAIARRLDDRNDAQVRACAMAHSQPAVWLFTPRKGRRFARSRWAKANIEAKKRWGKKMAKARARARWLRKKRERERLAARAIAEQAALAARASNPNPHNRTNSVSGAVKPLPVVRPRAG